MQLDELNLCDVVIEEMRKMEFDERSVRYLRGKQMFMDACGVRSTMQRNLLSIALYKVMMYSNVNVPKEVRLALNMANDNVGWIDDIKLVIIPYMKMNEEMFFPLQ